MTGKVFSSENAFPSKFLIYLEHCPRGEAVIIGHLRLSSMRYSQPRKTTAIPAIIIIIIIIIIIDTVQYVVADKWMFCHADTPCGWRQTEESMTSR